MDAETLHRYYTSGQRNFRGEILRDLWLVKADLRDADLHAADLSRADLTGAVLLSGETSS